MDKTLRDDRLTLILPVRDRFEFVARWFMHAEKVGLPFRVVVADGGRTGRVEQLLADPRRFPSVSYEYRRYPASPDYGGCIERLACSLEGVRTPYSCFVADDDFVVAGGYRRALDFLDAHPDYLSARGEILEFTIPGRNGQNAFGRPSFIHSGYFAVPSREEAGAFARIARQCDRFCAGFLNVQRTGRLHKRYAFMHSINAKETWCPDMIDDFALLAAGKVRHLPGLFALKQTNALGSEAHDIVREEPTVFDWMIRPGWSAEMRRMVEFVAGEIAEAEGMPREEALREFKRVYFARYLARICGEKARGLGLSLPGTRALRLGRLLDGFKGRVFGLRMRILGMLSLRRFMRSEDAAELRAAVESCGGAAGAYDGLVESFQLGEEASR